MLPLNLDREMNRDRDVRQLLNLIAARALREQSAIFSACLHLYRSNFQSRFTALSQSRESSPVNTRDAPSARTPFTATVDQWQEAETQTAAISQELNDEM